MQVSVNREAPLPDQAGTAALAEAEAWQTALALLNKGAADGDGHMHAILGALYAHGLGVTTPTQAGAEARLRALAENHAEPEDVAAEIEKMEDEVWAERRALAKQHFQQAAAKGVAEAMNNLAVLVIQVASPLVAPPASPAPALSLPRQPAHPRPRPHLHLASRLEARQQVGLDSDVWMRQTSSRRLDAPSEQALNP